MLLLGFHSGQKKAHASRKVLRVSDILQQCVMGIDTRSIPDCVSAPFFLTRVNRVNFVVTNVKVELRGTLVWFDSRIGLLQEKLQVYGWFWNFWHCMHASPNPACKSLWKLWKTRRTSQETLMVIIDFVLQFNWTSCRKSYCFLKEGHFDVVIIMVNHKDHIYWE